MGNTIKRIFNKNTNNIEVEIDLANWMGNLDEIKRNVPINKLAIPGSHDSMTYGITKKSQIAPDAEPIVKELSKYVCPFLNLIIRKWSITQKTNVKTQLNLGIRYLDLRVAKNDSDSKFYFVHGMYGNEINLSLREISEFLDEHSKEIIILDFQHFYNIKNSDHDRLINVLLRIFHDKLCKKPSNINFVTLNWMRQHGYQVIIIYRNYYAKQKPFLWTSYMWLTPWPNTMNVIDLLNYLKENLVERPDHVGYVSQCVLTPKTTTILKNPFSGVFNTCALPVYKHILPWIEDDSPPLNVAIADFIELNNAEFPKSIISLNL